MVSKLSVVFKYLNLVYWHRFNCKTLSKKISYHLMNPFIQIPMISYVHERKERERERERERFHFSIYYRPDGKSF